MSDVLLSYWLIDCQIGFLRSKPQHSHNGHNFCKQKPSCLIIRLLFVIFDFKTFKPSWHLFPRVTAPRRAAVCWWASRPRERKRFQKRSSPLKANLPGWLGRLRCTRIFASILFILLNASHDYPLFWIFEYLSPFNLRPAVGKPELWTVRQ